MIAEPLTDISILEKRQQIIKNLLNNKTLFYNLSSTLESMQIGENSILQLWGRKGFENKLQKRCFFTLPGFRGLNKSPLALLSRSMFGRLRNKISIK